MEMSVIYFDRYILERGQVWESTKQSWGIAGGAG